MPDQLPANVRPNYLANVEATIDNSDLAQFAKPPRIKTVQSMTGAPIKPPFKDGDIVILPQLTKIGDGDTPFTFVVCHFFPTWICMNPIQMKGQLKAIRDFSMDPQSEVAKKCKSFTKEKCPENPEYPLSYAETLNFMCVIEDNPDFADVPIHMFFARGEYTTGQKLIGFLQARKAPRYAARFRAASSLHTGKKGQWYGLDIMNDPEPWVSEENFFKYKKFYEDLKKLVSDQAVDLDLNEMEVPDTTTEF